MKKHARKTTPFLLLILSLILLIVLATVATREDLKVQKYHLESEKISQELRFVMISDLHGSYYGKKQQQLLQKINDLSPSAVLLVGDLFDEDTNHAAAKDLLAGLFGKYPCYYVSGNHEYVAGFEEITGILSEYNITCLWGEGQKITLNGQEIFLSGLADENHNLYSCQPSLPMPYDQFAEIESKRSEQEKELFSLLLCHRPNITLSTSSNYDLVLSGHNHGGQVRLPGLINGLFTPGEGLFPKYPGGRYDLADNTSLIIGRGLSKNTIPRIFNRPELVYIEITPTNAPD